TECLVASEGLEDGKFAESPQGLVSFRTAFTKAGMREEARRLTYAINHRQTRLAWAKPDWREKLEAVFKWGMFDKTCKSGGFPGSPLRILGVLLVGFTIPYYLALSSKGAAGIWAIWLPDRVQKSEGQDTPVRVTQEFLFSRWQGTW